MLQQLLSKKINFADKEIVDLTAKRQIEKVSKDLICKTWI